MTDELKASLITLRSALPDDEAFLYQLYGTTRTEEMRAWGLEAAQQEMILKLQFTAPAPHRFQIPPTRVGGIRERTDESFS